MVKYSTSSPPAAWCNGSCNAAPSPLAAGGLVLQPFSLTCRVGSDKSSLVGLN